MKNFFEMVNLNKGDKVLVSSDILKILMLSKKKQSNLNPNKIIDMLIEKIGTEGTLLFPTYNWDFCKGIEFNYKKTYSLSGALGNSALKRKDFIRTKNPIYSFAVTGKDQILLSKINHKSCFSLDSPFGYLIKNRGKNLFIDIDYKSGFTFCHVAEESARVSYRYLKKFTGYYLDGSGQRNKKTHLMYVRDPKSNVSMTVIHKDFDDVLKKSGAIQKIIIDKVKLTLIDIQKAYRLMIDDLKNNGGLIYAKKN